MKIHIIIFLIISLGILVYSNSLGNDFVWDDNDFVIQNDFIKDLKLIPFYFISKSALAKGGLAADNYRPLLSLSYAIDYFFWRLNPLGYHTTNLFFHIANAILLFFLLLSLIENRFIATLVSLFFLSHPIETESVTWISGRASVLFLFFYLAALISYIKYTKKNRITLYFTSILFFSFSLLSKEMAATLPLIIVLCDFYYGKREKISSRAIRYFAFFLLLELYVILRFNVIGKIAQADYWTGSLYTTFLTMTKGILYYIRLLVYPANLCVDYLTFPISLSIKEPAVLFSIMAIMLLIASAAILAKRQRLLSFSILWFFITLAPAVNIIPIKILIAERFLYLPSIGYFIFVALVLKTLLNKFKKRPIISYSLFCLPFFLIPAYSYLTMIRNVDWSSEITLWRKAVQSYPDNPRAHHNLAVAYIIRENDIDKAYEEVKIALEIAPSYPLARMMLASYYVQNNKFSEAIEEAKHMLEGDPDFLHAHQLLGAIYAIQRRYDLAYIEYTKALAKDSDFLEAKLGIANLASMKGEVALAIKKYEEILAENPPHHYRPHYAAAHLRVGELYADLGKQSEAIKFWERVYSDFKEQVWFSEISKFLVEKISLEELLKRTASWQPEFKVIAYYYVGIKNEMEADFESAKEYYRKCTETATQTVQQIKVLAEERLKRLEGR